MSKLSFLRAGRSTARMWDGRIGPATSLGSTHRLAKMLPPTLAGSFALSSASISQRTLGSTNSSMKTRWRWATAACRTWPRSSGSIIKPPSTSASRQLRQDATQPILNGAPAGQRATARWMVTARCNRWCTERRLRQPTAGEVHRTDRSDVQGTV